MLDKLLDILLQFGTLVAPFAVVKVYEHGVVLRVGRCHRVLEPGFHWKWPFAEDVVDINTVVTTMRLPPQTLTTKDDVSVVVSAIVKYQIVDPTRYLSEIWDAGDVLGDTTMGAVRQAIGGMNYKDLMAESPEKQVIQIVRNEVNQYGFKIFRITFTDLAKVRSYRLIQQAAKDLDN